MARPTAETHMKIAMIGTGYVGLVSGVCFSDFGHEVVCVDKDPAKIDTLERGEIPIYEPGLDVLLAKNVEQGRLSFTQDLKAAVDGAAAADLGDVVDLTARIANVGDAKVRVRDVATVSRTHAEREVVVVAEDRVGLRVAGEQVDELCRPKGNGAGLVAEQNPRGVVEARALEPCAKSGEAPV